MIYAIGALGCCLAAWLLFRRAGRAWAHFFVITVMVLLFTPYAVDAETMTMAPAIFALVFGFMTEGFESIKPVIKLMLGLWVVLLVLSFIYQLLTRVRHQSAASAEEYDRQEEVASRRAQHNTSKQRGNRYRDDEPPFDSMRGLSRDERQARAELLAGEEPMRAIR